MNRNFVIAASVAVFHMAALWALQSGLLQRAVEVVVPVEILSELIAPPLPKPPPPAPVQQARAAVPQPKAPSLPPPPMPLAVPDTSPAPAAPTGVTAPPAPLPPVTAPLAAAPAPPAPPAPAAALAPPRIELPSSDADYLQNARPNYPPLSQRLGEQGKVVVRVLIGVDGTAQQAEIRSSSGYERLDQAALATVKRWRYLPGKRNGVAEAMWFNVPINFVLE